MLGLFEQAQPVPHYFTGSPVSAPGETNRSTKASCWGGSEMFRVADSHV